MQPEILAQHYQQLLQGQTAMAQYDVSTGALAEAVGRHHQQAMDLPASSISAALSTLTV